jgi:hypothetical protein
LSRSRSPGSATRASPVLHDTELFSAQVAADATTVRNYDPHGYGGLDKRMDLPQNGPSACPSVYSFRYGNVGILSLDANDLSWEIQGLLGYSKGAQVAWLSEQLAAWRNDNVVDFIVAFFAQYQVDLVIQGHNHVYERTNPLIYDAATNSAKSSKQAVSVSSAEPAMVYPATDGTTYVVAGTAGTPAYGWSGARESNRNFAAGTGSGPTVVGDEKKQTGPWVNERDFSERFETVDWSQARYDDYGFVALDVVPALAGQTTTMTLRFINEQGKELDRVVFSRTAV